MKKILVPIVILILIVIFAMGLFSFLKKKKNETSNSIILGMVLLEEANSMQVKNVVSELRTKWLLEVNDEHTSDETSVLVIEGFNIAIGNMPMPIPGDEIETTAEFNYLWENGAEASKHKAHIIVSITNAGENLIKANLLFSKVISAILNNSKSLGVYIGGRTLLLSKNFYLANTEEMSDQNLPLFIWIYFGLRSENGKQSIFTYGLADFKKQEMEIINSDQSFEELSDMMFNLVHYVIASNVTLKNGETIGETEQQKLKIRESKGKYLEGKTLKIEY